MTPLVTPAEAAVLTVARGMVGATSTGALVRVLSQTNPAPTALSPTARGLLSDTLARGVVWAVAQHGGWYGPTPVWERPAPALHFSDNVVRLLQWAVEVPLASSATAELSFQAPVTPAEDCLLVLLVHRVRDTPVEATLCRQPALRQAPLVMLAHAGRLARWHSLPEPVPAIDVTQHAPFVVGLRGLMADAWYADETVKRDVERPEVLRRIGEAQQRVLDSFLKAITPTVATRALAGFLIDATARVVALPSMFDGLDATAPMRERMEARRTAAALLRAMSQLASWDAAHRASHFIDDEYSAAQALTRDWARLGPGGFREAARRVADIDALGG